MTECDLFERMQRSPLQINDAGGPRGDGMIGGLKSVVSTKKYNVITYGRPAKCGIKGLQEGKLGISASS